MRSTILAIALIAAVAGGTQRERTSGSGTRHSSPARPQPIVVLLRHSVWFPAIQWPLFILYDDGTAVFPTAQRDLVPQSYQTAKLDLRDRDRAFATLGIGREFFDLKPRYDFAPDVTDQETVFLLIWRGDSLTSVAVRAGVGSKGEFTDGVPKAFREAYEALTGFKVPGAAPWQPAELRVAAWPYEYAPDNPPLPWPRHWPNLKSAGSECHPDDLVEEMCTLHLPATDRDALERFLGQRREKQAIGINGRKMVMSYRLLFAGEERWRHAIGALES